MEIFTESLKFYFKKLLDKNSVCVISSEKDQLAKEIFEHRVINEKLLGLHMTFLFFDELGQEICLALSKRFNDCLVNSITPTTKLMDDEKLKVVVVLVNDSNEEDIDYFIKNNYKLPYTLLASGSIIGLSYLIAKFLTISVQPLEKKETGFFLNMVEAAPSIKNNGIIKMISRKNYPYEFLTESTESYQISAIAAHANSKVLYIGNKKIGYEQERDILSVVNNLTLESLFLDSCFGLSFSKDRDSLFENLCYSNLDSAVYYRGIKDNYFIECLWYITYRLRGRNSIEATTEVNKNLEFRTTDLPLYITVGYDESNYELGAFTEYVQSEEDLFNFETVTKNPSSLGFCRILSNVNEFAKLSLLSPRRVSWCIDYKNNEILLHSETIQLPNELNFVDLRAKFLKIRRDFNGIVDFKKSWGKELKNKLLLYEQQLNNVSLLLRKAQLFSDIAFKLNKKLQDLSILGLEIEELLLQEVGRDSMTTGPLSESYIDKFEVENVDFTFGCCPYCSSKTARKEIVSIIKKEERRFIEYCLKCGQINDLGVDFDAVSVLSVTKLEQKLEIILESKIENKVLIRLLGADSIIEWVTLGTNKLIVPIEEEKQFNVLKCFYIYSDKLNVVYKSIN